MLYVYVYVSVCANICKSVLTLNFNGAYHQKMAFYGGVNGDTPIWMVYFMENPKRTWMITRDTPISGNLHMVQYLHV